MFKCCVCLDNKLTQNKNVLYLKEVLLPSWTVQALRVV